MRSVCCTLRHEGAVVLRLRDLTWCSGGLWRWQEAVDEDQERDREDRHDPEQRSVYRRHEW